MSCRKISSSESISSAKESADGSTRICFRTSVFPRMMLELLDSKPRGITPHSRNSSGMHPSGSACNGSIIQKTSPNGNSSRAFKSLTSAKRDKFGSITSDDVHVVPAVRMRENNQPPFVQSEQKYTCGTVQALTMILPVSQSKLHSVPCHSPRYSASKASRDGDCTESNAIFKPHRPSFHRRT